VPSVWSGDLRARPNVTIDCAALDDQRRQRDRPARSSYAQRSNAALGRSSARRWSRRACGGSVLLLDAGDRDGSDRAGDPEGVVDLLIPRGRRGPEEAIKAVATVR